MMEGDGENRVLRLSAQLQAVIGTRDLGQMHDLLERISSGRLSPETDDVYVLSYAIRKLIGDLDHKGFHYWKKSGKIDRDCVRRDCRHALEMLATTVSGAQWDTRFSHKKKNDDACPLKRILTGEYPDLIRKKGRSGD